ncbi:MAG: conjugal transfer protein TraF [Methylomonas sp.]|jgi:conjugal transfer pilus assembly protein TraF|uniref:conjugal transfer protein TraF n=1 Tax=Methylomonas sp. TaxID=418 RepID=UPI0025E5A006|nr:conjugal transfer protein TraF [Methylomonas sp.]MCK9608915.1 conjugal transfer protein TraF [Methylomonas sp.]
MNPYPAVLLMVLTMLLQALPARADEAVDMPTVPYFEDKQRGWFWYEVLPEPVKKSQPEIQADQENPKPDGKPSSVVQAEIELKTQAHPSAEPQPLSSAWLKQNLEHYLNQAIDDPSPENVAAFYYLQRVMMDKAERFTNAARYVVMSDPQLDETVRRPVATYAANEANHQAGVVAERALKAIAAQAGILFFFRSDCPYCHVQAPILAMLENAYGFKIYPVSLDGLPMPNGFFSEFKRDNGQAAMLGVEQTPALFLMKPPKQIVPLAQGALSLEELTGRILLAAKEAGWIDASQYQTTQGIRNTPMLLPAAGSISPAVTQDPLSLIQALQRSAQMGSTP